VGRFTFPASGGSLIVDATRNGAFNPLGSIAVSGTSFDGTTQSGHFCGSSNYNTSTSYVPISLGASTQISSITLPGQFPGTGTMHLFALATQ